MPHVNKFPLKLTNESVLARKIERYINNSMRESINRCWFPAKSLAYVLEDVDLREIRKVIGGHEIGVEPPPIITGAVRRRERMRANYWRRKNAATSSKATDK